MRYDGAESLSDCGVTIGGQTSGSNASQADAQDAVRYLDINPRQLFRGIIFDPPHVGCRPLPDAALMRLATPCSGGWCDMTISYHLSASNWRVKLSINFNRMVEPSTGLLPLWVLKTAINADR